MHGRSLAVALWRRRWAALLVLVLELAAVAGWLVFAPRTYTATATVSAAPQQELLRTPGIAGAFESTVARLANSRSVLLDVRDRVGDKRTAGRLRTEVHGERIAGTVLIRITVQDTDRVYARNVANAVVDVLPRHDPSGGMLLFTDAGRAATPIAFSSPDVGTDLLVGVGIGIVLALATAYLRELAAGKVEDAGQLVALTDAPVLASIGRPGDPLSVPAANPGAVAAEFRALRVALEFASSDEPTHTVVLSPLIADPASAWVTVNLACALAQVQHRVLVIDADFSARTRHPALMRKGAGLAEVLRGERELRDVVRPCEVPSVSVVPVGKLDGTSAANLIELGFHAMLGDLQDEVDIVLVHAGPLAESDDARVMAVGNTLLITVAAGRVRPKTLRDVVTEVRQYRLRLLGTVLIGGRRAG